MTRSQEDTLGLLTPGSLSENTTKGPGFASLWKTTSKGAHDAKSQRLMSIEPKLPCNGLILQSKKAPSNMFQWTSSLTSPSHKDSTPCSPLSIKAVPRPQNSSPATRPSTDQ